MDAEFVHQVLSLLLHGRGADLQEVGDVLVGAAPGDEAEHFSFPAREPVSPLSLRPDGGGGTLQHGDVDGENVAVEIVHRLADLFGAAAFTRVMSCRFASMSAVDSNAGGVAAKAHTSSKMQRSSWPLWWRSLCRRLPCCQRCRPCGIFAAWLCGGRRGGRRRRPTGERKIGPKEECRPGSGGKNRRPPRHPAGVSTYLVGPIVRAGRRG